MEERKKERMKEGRKEKQKERVFNEFNRNKQTDK